MIGYDVNPFAKIEGIAMKSVLLFSKTYSNKTGIWCRREVAVHLGQESVQDDNSSAASSADDWDEEEDTRRFFRAAN